MDRIPERLRCAAEGVAKATQMMADAKSKRNQAAGDVGASYSGLKREQTAEWQAADMIERYIALLERTRTILGNMAQEREGFWNSLFGRRWVVNHEPLRGDARNLLPLIDAEIEGGN